jgi:protein-S-isoprenylcysteine O-methyltransferase Ste14
MSTSSVVITSKAPDPRLMRFFNPFVARLLRSSLHGLLSSNLLLLTLTGRRSSRQITLPVGYTRDADSLLVISQHSDQKQWWRNLRGGAPVRLCFGGRQVAGHAEVLEEHVRVAAELDRLIDRLGASEASRRLYLSLDDAQQVPPEALAGIVLVRITPDSLETAQEPAAVTASFGLVPFAMLRQLVGAGDRIGMFALPFAVTGLVLNLRYPSRFEVGGPPRALQTISRLVLISGLATWAWSVVLIITRVPQGKLISSGPYALVKHPLYTSVSLLVLPWVGFLRNTWLGAVLGLVLYTGSRRFAPAEEADLAKSFGPAWEAYCARVKIPWL